MPAYLCTQCPGRQNCAALLGDAMMKDTTLCIKDGDHKADFRIL